MRSDDLRYFLKVVSVGKLGPASEVLGISQPALSKAIGRIEAELGGDLFRRTGRGMELTELGLRFERRAQKVIDEVSQAMADARALNPHEGAIRFGVGPLLLPMVIGLCEQFVRQRPLVRFEMVMRVADYLESSLSAGAIDVAIASESESNAFPEDLASQPLVETELCVAAGPDHPLIRPARPLTLADLVGYHWALPSGDTAVRKELTLRFQEKALPPPVARIECEDSTAILPMALRCGLLTLFPRQAARANPSASISVLDVTDWSWRRNICLLTRRDFPLPPVVADFVVQIKRLGSE